MLRSVTRCCKSTQDAVNSRVRKCCLLGRPLADYTDITRPIRRVELCGQHFLTNRNNKRLAQSLPEATIFFCNCSFRNVLCMPEVLHIQFNNFWVCKHTCLVYTRERINPQILGVRLARGQCIHCMSVHVLHRLALCGI